MTIWIGMNQIARAVKREYQKLVPRPTLLKGFVYDAVPMKDGDSIRSGERMDVIVTVDIKNDYAAVLREIAL